MAELADAEDLKSSEGNLMRVRVPLRAPEWTYTPSTFLLSPGDDASEPSGLATSSFGC